MPDIVTLPLTVPVWAAGSSVLALVALGGALLFAVQRLGDLASERGRADAEAVRWREIATMAADGFFAWDLRGGGEICSRRLALQLGLPSGTAAPFSEVADRFADPSAVWSAAHALRSAGESFRLILPLRSAGRSAELAGMRLLLPTGAPLADIVWIRDLSDLPDRLDRAVGAREAAATERARLTAALDALPLPVWLRDRSLDLIWCNRAFAAAVDATSRESAVVEQRELDLGAGGQRRALARTALSQAKPAAERHHVTIDGQRRLLSLTEQRISDGTAVAGWALDLTPVEEMEAELDRHVAAHAEVLERLATAIAIYGPDTRLVFFNSAFQRLWGLEPDWLREEPTFGEVLEALREHRRLPEQPDFPAYKAAELRRFQSLIEPVEDLIHLPDTRTLRRVITPHPFGGLLLTYEDVTDTLALERSYNTLIAVQRETLDNLYEGVAVFASDGRMRLFNPAFAGLWRLDPDWLAAAPHVAEVVERMRPLLAAGTDWPDLPGRLLALFDERTPQQVQVECGDGAVIECATVPLPDGGTLFGALDVTDSVRVERALWERNEALQAANRLTSDFIASVSDEIRPPLDTVAELSERLARDLRDPQKREAARGIREASQTLVALLSDILDLAILEAGQMTLELDTVDIRGMVNGVLALVREQARRRSLTLASDIQPRIGWMVADERRVKQVLYNLLANAVRFTPRGGSVTVSARRDGEEIVLAVADTGAGIAEADQARIFDRFVRGPDGGAGLGLALVKSFVELHGGRIDVDSERDRGTTITCRLPAAGTGEEPQASPE